MSIDPNVLLPIIVFLVLLIYFISVFFSWKLKKRSHAIKEKHGQERIFQKKQAELVVSISSHDENKPEGIYEKALVIKNRGESEARNVMIFIEDKNTIELIPHNIHYAVVESSRNKISTIDVDSEVRIYLEDRKLPRSFDIKILWYDDSGEKRELQTTLKK